MSVAQSIERHKAEGRVSIDRHVKRRAVALGRDLEPKTAIYLDIKFWIILREVALGRNRDAAASELLRLLRAGAAAGRLFCPASESVFLELLKQSDAATRTATAQLVDELSLGATLLHNQARFATEVAHFFHSFEQGANLHPLRHLVWSKLSYVLGVQHPSETAFDAETELAVQKAFFDHMWEIPLAAMVGMIKDVPDPDGLKLSDIALMLNEGAARHADSIVSFERALSDELRGVADLCADMAVEVLSDMAEKKGERPVSRGTPQWTQCRSMCANILFRALQSNTETRLQLRTLYIEACLHAAFRWDKKRRFTGNDLYDFNHASAALGYCHAFFTERPLHALVSSSKIALDQLYGCRVVSNIAEAVAFLKTLDLDSGGAPCTAQRDGAEEP